MNHPFLHPVAPEKAKPLVCYDRLNVWLARLPDAFRSAKAPPPKASLLCGLPCSGRGTVARIIARILERPLYRLDPACDSLTLTESIGLLGSESPSILWLDRPGEAHIGIIRWLLDAPRSVFLLMTTDQPYKLPADFLRPDVTETIWFLDVLSARQRAAVWDQLVSDTRAFDQVKLAQARGMLGPEEIRTAVQIAKRGASEEFVIERELGDAAFEIRPIALELEDMYARLREWASSHATPAASERRRFEDD